MTLRTRVFNVRSKFIIKDIAESERILSDYEMLTQRFMGPGSSQCECDSLTQHWRLMFKKAEEYLKLIVALEKRTSRMHRAYAKKKGRR